MESVRAHPPANSHEELVEALRVFRNVDDLDLDYLVLALENMKDKDGIDRRPNFWLAIIREFTPKYRKALSKLEASTVTSKGEGRN